MKHIISLGAGVQQIELAWAAGFFDGEGNTRLETSSDGLRRYLRVSIGQTDREVLDRFQRAVGGVGKIYGPYTKSNDKWQPIWTYLVRAADARAVLESILPYCSTPKQKQAMEMLTNEKVGGGLDHCKNKTHCPSGHPYDEVNTYWWRGYRSCKACQKERDRVRSIARKEARNEAYT